MTKRRALTRTAAVLTTGVLVALAGLSVRPAHGAQKAGGGLILPDPVGDVVGAAGPDIASVAVADDGRQATIAVTTVAALPDYCVVLVAVDADRSRDTGYLGDDELVAASLRPSDYASVFARWDGSTWRSFEPTTASSVDVTTNTVVFRLAKADILGSGAFDFSVSAMLVDPDGNTLSEDVAPDSAVDGTGFPYTFGSTTPPTANTPSAAPNLTFGAVRVAPSPVRAGHRETLTFPVHAGEGVVVGGAIGVAARVTLGGRPIAHTTRWSNGSAVVTVPVPSAAHGKRLVVRVSLGGSWIRSVSYLVR